MKATLSSASTRDAVRETVASKVSEALTDQPGLSKSAMTDIAEIVAAVAAAIVGLTPAQRKRLRSKSSEVADMIAVLVRDARMEIAEPVEIERGKGRGFGELIDIEEGRRRISAYATKVPLEEWAGPLAGSSELKKCGITRPTLHAWRKRGHVIALPTDARNHAFPLEQFVDGRPVEGIGEIVKVSDNPRRAWFWLVQRSPLLRNKRPIDILKQGRKGEVIEAARTVFDYP